MPLPPTPEGDTTSANNVPYATTAESAHILPTLKPSLGRLQLCHRQQQYAENALNFLLTARENQVDTEIRFSSAYKL